MYCCSKYNFIFFKCKNRSFHSNFSSEYKVNAATIWYSVTLAMLALLSVLMVLTMLVMFVTVTSMGHKVIIQNFKITLIKLEMHFYETYDIPLDNFEKFGFRCPLEGASGGVKGVSGAILTP